MSTRVAMLVVAGALGCARMTAPPDRAYRAIRGVLTPALLGSENGSGGYAFHLEEGVVYTVEVTEAAGVVRIRTVIRNGGREPVRYDLARAVVAAADGALLRA